MSLCWRPQGSVRGGGCSVQSLVNNETWRGPGACLVVTSWGRSWWETRCPVYSVGYSCSLSHLGIGRHMFLHSAIKGYACLSMCDRQALTHSCSSPHHNTCMQTQAHTYRITWTGHSHLHSQHHTESMPHAASCVLHPLTHPSVFCWTLQNCHSVSNFLWLKLIYTHLHKIPVILYMCTQPHMRT